MVDHFKVSHLIGQGGMGEVYLARDTRLGRKVALKLVRAEEFGDPEVKRQFLFEARITAQFNHPNIVTIHAVGEHLGYPYLALEYLDGESLRARLEHGPLGMLEAARIGLSIAEALAQAHSHNVLHRDLKPDNVYLCKDGRLRVLDFGLAKIIAPILRERASKPPSGLFTPDLPPQSPIEDGGLIGTPHYMAPEQWGLEEVSGPTDIFALGCILYEMLTGRPPFQGETLRGLRDLVCFADRPPIDTPGVLLKFKELVTGCLATEPKERPSLEEIIATLGDILARRRGQVTAEENPFRGLLPFTEEHAGMFYGRDEEVGAFVERLRQTPMLAVVGPSGAGKSSFVQAGVVPRLKEQGPWIVLSLRPGTRPFEALAGAIIRARMTIPQGTKPSLVTVNPDEESALAAELMYTPGLAGIRLLELAEQECAEVLLFVDQLEELVALCPDEEMRRWFMESLSAAADHARAPVRVVVTLRDDFLGKLAEGSAARSGLSQVVVIRSPEPSALAVIASRPLEDAGYAYEDPALPHLMATSVQGEVASLPLLQFALSALWKARDQERKLIPQSAYEAIGGVEGALAQHADGIMSGLSGVDIKAAREIFLRLVTPSGTRRAMTRLELLSGLPASAGEVLDRLVQERTIVARKGRGKGEAEFEIVHESLIRRWQQLARWLSESREEHSFLAEATQAADLWQNRGRNADELWQGDALRDAERLATRLQALPDNVKQFLDAGRRNEGRRQNIKRLAVLFAFTFLVLVAAGLFFFSREAQRQRAVAQAQRQAAEIQRAEAEEQRAQALFAMAQALIKKAKEHNAALDYTSAAVYAAASLLHNPANPGSSRYRSSFATGSESARDLLIDARGELYLAQLGSFLGRHRRFAVSSEVRQIALTQDGSRLIAGLNNGHIAVFDVASGKRVIEKPMHPDIPISLAVSPSGALAASSSSSEQVIRLWRPDTGERMGELVGYKGEVGALVFTPDGASLVSGGQDGAIRFWDIATQRQTAMLAGSGAEVTSLALSKSGHMLAAGTWDGVLSTWALPEGTLGGRRNAHTDIISDIAFIEKDGILVTSSGDGTVGTWQAGDLALMGRKDFKSGFIFGMRPLGDGPLIATLNIKRDLVVTHASSGRDLLRIPQAYASEGIHPATTPSGEFMAFQRDGQTIEVWRQVRPPRLSVFGVDTHRIMGLAWSPDGTLLASASLDKTLRIWDARSGQQRQEMKSDSESTSYIVFSKDNSRLVSLNRDKTLKLWDVEQGALVASVDIDDDTWGFGLSPDGTTVALNGGEGCLWLVELASGKVTKRPDIKMQRYQPAEYVSPGSLLIGRQDDGMEVWDLDSGNHRRLALQSTCSVSGWLPQRRLLSCASWAEKIFFLFDPHKDQEVWRVPLRHDGPFRNSMDERFSFMVSNNFLTVLSLDTGAPIMRQGFPGGYVRPSPDGKALAFTVENVIMTMPFEPEALAGIGTQADKKLAEAEALAGRRLNGFDLEPLDDLVKP
jgi:WD40 repeat protein/tRNA A-37 threonylcarbamoyl transferase component Bud32